MATTEDFEKELQNGISQSPLVETFDGSEYEAGFRACLKFALANGLPMNDPANIAVQLNDALLENSLLKAKIASMEDFKNELKYNVGRIKLGEHYDMIIDGMELALSDIEPYKK